jgi:hypothetical protein
MKTSELIFDKTLSGIYFGNSVALTSQNLAFIGAYNYNNSGTVFTYKKYDSEWDWNELVKINSSNQEIGEGFGYSISANDGGTILAVASPFKNQSDGVVYIFTGNGSQWNESYRISGMLSKTESFGYDLDLNPQGNKLVIGTNIYNSSTGKAYLYTGVGNSWSLSTGFYKNDGTLTPNNKYKSFYGNKVAINSGNAILIGSILNDNNGALFIYTGNNNTWLESQKLIGTYNSLFGNNFYITNNSNYILVGAPNTLAGIGGSSGSVYVYEKNGNSWQNTHSITGSTIELGQCLFINESGDFIFASENNYSGAINNYIKTGNTWYKNLTIKNPRPNAGKYFGNEFVVGNGYNGYDRLLVGASNFLFSQGAAYAYDGPWNNFQEYYAISEYYLSGVECYCDEFASCSDCCGISPSFELITGYVNNLNQFSAEISITIQNNNCNPIYDIFRVYSNGIKTYNSIYHTLPFRQYDQTITLKNIKPINNLINLEIKAYNLGQDYSYVSGININNY